MEKKVNLDLPVNAYDADGNLQDGYVEHISDDSSTDDSQSKETVVENKPIDEVEEQRVPYSRFETVRRQKDEAERDAEEARSILRQALSRQPDTTPSQSSYDEDYARELKKLYGDSPVAQEIIEINLKHQHEIEERAERRAIEAIERREHSETIALRDNEATIDQRLESLSDYLGRKLSDGEESAILDIVDEYTPTGEDGKYAGEILPFDKAWEIYELKNASQGQSSRRARNAATVASSARSEGESTSVTEERNKNFNPLNWKSLYDRIK